MTRREAREQAFEMVFEMGFQNLPIAELTENAVDGRDLQLDDYAVQATGAVQQHLAAIDAVIDVYSTKWKLGRLPKVTLAILRLAICELDFIPEVPEGAVINEAVELAKKYGTEEDASYVNGVLGGYVRKKTGEIPPTQPQAE
ncbi:MAG: transcription antitermination factor NusB [Angelakisella sp.]